MNNSATNSAFQSRNIDPNGLCAYRVARLFTSSESVLPAPRGVFLGATLRPRLATPQYRYWYIAGINPLGRVHLYQISPVESN